MQTQPDFELAEPEGMFREGGIVRDPRFNPQPGDILRVGSEQREVVDVQDGRVEYGFPNRAATRWLSAFEWQRWARKADVVKVAL